jgi:quinol-cytochrome oxidoreductase complex cytochrome b subunit
MIRVKDNRIYWLRRLIVLLFVWVMGGLLHAQPALQEEVKKLEDRADALLALSPADQKEAIKKLTPEEAKALMNTLSRRALAKDPAIAPVFYLYEHLAALDATDLAQKRLNRLLVVFVITLVLFVAYLLYLLFQQNQIVRLLSAQKTQEDRSEEPVKVYRGD